MQFCTKKRKYKIVCCSLFRLTVYCIFLHFKGYIYKIYEFYKLKIRNVKYD